MIELHEAGSVALPAPFAWRDDVHRPEALSAFAAHLDRMRDTLLEPFDYLGPAGYLDRVLISARNLPSFTMRIGNLPAPREAFEIDLWVEEKRADLPPGERRLWGLGSSIWERFGPEDDPRWKVWWLGLFSQDGIAGL